MRGDSVSPTCSILPDIAKLSKFFGINVAPAIRVLDFLRRSRGYSKMPWHIERR